MRAWLVKNAGIACIVAGWLCAFALAAIPKTRGNAVSIIELACFGSAFFGFGLGWIARGGRGGGDADQR